MPKSTLIRELLESERTSGVVLLLCTAGSLLLTNSAAHEGYTAIWGTVIATHPLAFWINDGLMTVFFLMIGLELKRELRAGELADRKRALLPVIAALGGMIVPAGIHALFNAGMPTAAGAGIPMATDIAFAVGILSLLGKRVPAGLSVFLLALAVIDDLGAIVAIALFYSHGLAWGWLAGAAGVFGLLLYMGRWNRFGLWIYLLLGAALWYGILRSGVHATISGVLLAFALPFGDGGKRSMSARLQHALHWPVAFGIMPLFALANTCVVFTPGWFAALSTPNSLGILVGLVVGKPAGIVLFALGAVALGWCALPAGTHRWGMLGVGMLGGIGFTMSIFITLLAFQNEALVNEAKTAVLMASLLAGLLGAAVLRVVHRRPRA